MKFALLLFVCFAVAYCVQATGGGGGGSGTTPPTHVTPIPHGQCFHCHDDSILDSLVCFLQSLLGTVGLLAPGGSAATCVKCDGTVGGGYLGEILCQVKDLLNDIINNGGGGEDGKGCYYCKKPNGGVIDAILCLVLRVIDILGLRNQGTKHDNCVRCVPGSNNDLEKLICAIQELIGQVAGGGI